MQQLWSHETRSIVQIVDISIYFYPNQTQKPIFYLFKLFRSPCRRYNRVRVVDWMETIFYHLFSILTRSIVKIASIRNFGAAVLIHVEIKCVFKLILNVMDVPRMTTHSSQSPSVFFCLSSWTPWMNLIWAEIKCRPY